MLVIIWHVYLERHNQLANIIHLQIAMKYKLLDRNTPPYCRYKLEPMLESGNMILYWDKSIVTDKMVDFNRHDIVLKDWEQNNTCNRYSSSLDFSKTEAQKIMKYEKLALEIKISGTLTT